MQSQTERIPIIILTIQVGEPFRGHSEPFSAPRSVSGTSQKETCSSAFSKLSEAFQISSLRAVECFVIRRFVMSRYCSAFPRRATLLVRCVLCLLCRCWLFHVRFISFRFCFAPYRVVVHIVALLSALRRFVLGSHVCFVLRDFVMRRVPVVIRIAPLFFFARRGSASS